MLGRAPPDTSCPEFVQDLHRTLKRSFDLTRCRLRAAHLRGKTQYDRHGHHTPFHNGDRVWLFVPAVKPGRTKKFASLWRGPYTVLDKVSPVTYRIQLIGSHHQLVVHHNRLKLCLGAAHRQRGTYTSIGTTTTGQAERIRDNGANDDPPHRLCQGGSGAPTTCSHVAGYTSSSDIAQPPPRTPRPVRHRQPPNRYGQFVQY